MPARRHGESWACPYLLTQASFPLRSVAGSGVLAGCGVSGRHGPARYLPRARTGRAGVRFSSGTARPAARDRPGRPAAVRSLDAQGAGSGGRGEDARAVPRHGRGGGSGLAASAPGMSHLLPLMTCLRSPRKLIPYPGTDSPGTWFTSAAHPCGRLGGRVRARKTPRSRDRPHSRTWPHPRCQPGPAGTRSQRLAPPPWGPTIGSWADAAGLAPAPPPQWPAV